MKILITGGYGFIGSHIADKFHREGHSIFIIDNLTTGKIENFIHKHRFHDLSVEDSRCEEVFKSNHFDVVIHLAAQVDELYSQKNSFHDTKINILGLVNMLNLSVKYKVKKFIFASSASVYGNDTNFPSDENSKTNPLSVYATNKRLGEYYCETWSKQFDLDTISLRISNVYGPRQDSEGGGVIASFLEKYYKGKGITIYGDGEQLRDFLYVEDVADAFYKAAAIKYNGVLNLCSGTMTSINHLVKLIERDNPFSTIQHVEHRPREIKKSDLNNNLIVKVLDWIPLTTLEEGLFKSSFYYANTRYSTDTVSTQTKESKNKNISFFKLFKNEPSERKWLPYIENIAAFSILTLISISNHNAVTSMPIDLNLLLIIIFTVLYGSRQGIVSFVLSVISSVFIFIGTGHDPLVLLYSTDFFIMLACYVFVAFFIGYVKDRLTRKNVEQNDNILILNDKMTFVTNLYHDMRDVRDELQSQIVNSEDSFGKIFSILQELDTLNPEEVFAKAISVLEKLMKTQGVAIYRFTETSRYARLMACSPDLNNIISKSVSIEDYSELIHVIIHKDLYVSRELKEGKPIMIMPVFDHANIVGSILIYKTDFERLTLSYQNYFRVITDLISSTLSKAYLYDAAIESEKYIQGTNILRPAVFDEVLASKRVLKSKHQLHYVLLKVKLNGTSQKGASEKIGSVLRDTDFVGIDDDSNLIVVLGNTTEKESEFVIGRLTKLGLDTVLLDEVEMNE